MISPTTAMFNKKIEEQIDTRSAKREILARKLQIWRANEEYIPEEIIQELIDFVSQKLNQV